MKTITKDNVADHVDDLIELAKEVKYGKITIVTGSNGSGKSFLRKLMSGYIKDKKGKDITVASISMERRAGLNMHGAMAAFIQDAEWEPTSKETIKQINALLSQQDRFLIIDEAEIGMGDELVLGLVAMLNEKLNKVSHGVVVITHSRVIVEHLKHDKFINLDGLTREQWLSRKIEPMDVDALEERSTIIYREIQKRINEAEKKKYQKD